MSNNRNLGNIATAITNATSGQVLTSQGSGVATFADAGGTGVTVHTNQAIMLTDAASADEGSLHYENANNKLYVKQSSGFFLLASITNTAPTVSSFTETTGSGSASDITDNGTFSLTSGSNTVITLTATDPDLETLVYSATVTSGTASNVISSPSLPISNQSGNTFTLTPVTSGTGGTIIIRFDVSDGNNVVNKTHSFSIAFKVVDSNYTTLLATATGTSDNNDIIDSSSNGYNITVNNDAHAGTFSPYRSGGYSTYFDGNGDWLTLTGTALGNGNFTVEAWVWLDSLKNYNVIYDDRATGSSAAGLALGVTSTGAPYLFTNNGFRITSSQTCTAKTWHHISLVRSSGVITIYLDGASGGTYNSSANFTDTNLGIGVGNANTLTSQLDGYMSDVRAVVGSAITPPSGGPTERLEAVSGTGYSTSLLTCHLPYIADGSTNDHSITINGDPSTKPFSPYDYDEYDATDHGGSINFDGTGDYLDTNSAINLSSGGCIEGWVYITSTTNYAFFIASTQGAGNFESRWQVGHSNAGDWRVAVGDAIPNNLTSYDLIKNQWNHFVLSNDGSRSRLFANGVLIFTKSVTPLNENLTFTLSKYGPYAQYPMTGNLSDVRVTTSIPTEYQTSSTTVGSSIFTPPTAPLSSSGASLHIKGTDASIIDKSQGSNLKLEGNTTGSTTQVKFSNTKSMYFDGNGDYLTLPQILLGSGNFTIEAWTYLESRATTYPAIFSNYSSFSAGSLGLFAGHGSSTTTNYQVSHNGSGFPAINAGTVSYDQWVHLALVRNSGTITLYKDGTSIGSFTSSADLSGVGSNFYIGAAGDNISTSYIDGYIQDFRITKGKARYTASDETANIPTAPLEG